MDILEAKKIIGKRTLRESSTSESESIEEALGAGRVRKLVKEYGARHLGIRKHHVIQFANADAAEDFVVTQLTPSDSWYLSGVTLLVRE